MCLRGAAGGPNPRPPDCGSRVPGGVATAGEWQRGKTREWGGGKDTPSVHWRRASAQTRLGFAQDGSPAGWAGPSAYSRHSSGTCL